MLGYPFRGDPDTAQKTGVVICDRTAQGEVVVRTAATVEFSTILLVRRAHAKALPALREFYELGPQATFPENTGDVHGLVNGIRFDRADYVYHRYDQASGDIVFRPLDAFTQGLKDAEVAQEVQATLDTVVTPEPVQHPGSDHVPTQVEKDQGIVDYAHEVETARIASDRGTLTN
jgi:hypothetical protein